MYRYGLCTTIITLNIGNTVSEKVALCAGIVLGKRAVFVKCKPTFLSSTASLKHARPLQQFTISKPPSLLPSLLLFLFSLICPISLKNILHLISAPPALLFILCQISIRFSSFYVSLYFALRLLQLPFFPC